MSCELSVIIVSWNVCNLLQACLDSLRLALKGIHAEVFVVDNASQDMSAEMVASKFPEVNLIKNSENIGFGPANNQALRKCQGENILLLNPDTAIPEDAIQRMLDFLNAHPDAGLIGPEQRDGSGKILANWVRFAPNEMLEFFIERISSIGLAKTRILFPYPRRVKILNAACWMTRQSVFSEIGFFDDDFFMYAEEPDICSRLQQAGWEIWLLRDIEIVHHKRQSIRQEGILVELGYFFQSMTLWLHKLWKKKSEKPR